MESGDGHMSVEASIPWAENTVVFEIVEAVMNLVATEHMVRPWSYQGMNIMRCLHEVKFFAHVCASSREQKNMCETFVNEVLGKNVTREIIGKPPMSITECLEVSTIVCARNGGQMTDLHRRIDPYSAFRACKEKDAEITRLKTLLNASNNRPRANPGATGTVRPRGTGGGGAGGMPQGNGYFGGRHGGGAQGGGAQSSYEENHL